jgi:predicted enzyme related to lactoylglutathione lyase
MEDRMNRNKTIDYVEFHSDNLPATRQFYRQVFGWEFEDYGPEYTSFKDGRIAGGFSLGPVSPGAGPLIVIYVDDLQATQLQIREAGGKITKEIFSFPGGSRFHFADPSGNELAAWTEG